jgi:hypothetical protein
MSASAKAAVSKAASGWLARAMDTSPAPHQSPFRGWTRPSRPPWPLIQLRERDTLILDNLLHPWNPPHQLVIVPEPRAKDFLPYLPAPCRMCAAAQKRDFFSDAAKMRAV